jgi:hypothetical protein
MRRDEKFMTPSSFPFIVSQARTAAAASTGTVALIQLQHQHQHQQHQQLQAFTIPLISSSSTNSP